MKKILKPKKIKVFTFDESINTYEYLIKYVVFGKIIVEIFNWK